MMQAKIVPMATATIGPSSWRSSAVKDIKLSQSLVIKNQRSLETGKATDPVPHLREVAAELGNEVAHRYYRDTRDIVNILRESLLETNEEIKSLTRTKEALERAIEHKRKDLTLNKESTLNRSTRPIREKDQDGADDLLQAERQHLLNLKRILESQLRLVQQQLRVLDSARKRLAKCVSERSRVLDLVCHSVSSSANLRNSLRNSRAATPNGYASARGVKGERYGRSTPVVDPLGSYTPEAEQALMEAGHAISRSAMLRKDSAEAIEKTDRLQQMAHKSVNDGLLQKIAETETLKQHLEVTSGENRHSVNRAQRFLDQTERARGITCGPVSFSDLTSREKLDRPIIRVFQRHPGTQLPEAKEIIKGTNNFLDSLTATTRNIALLNLSQMRLQDNIRDKNAGQDVDAAVLRLRRRRADHKWNLGEAF